jgi:hypothetical protein
MPHDPLCAAAVDFHFAGLRALDAYRLAQIADKLDVSVDWLLGRSDMMELTKAKAKRPVRSSRAASFASNPDISRRTGASGF